MTTLEATKGPEVLTIGYSNHSSERFLELLRENAVTAIADVRSQPYSRFNPSFSRDALQETLRKAGVAYVFLGRELGARSDDPACYEKGRVLYRRLAERPLFREGLARVIKGAETQRVALMCAEGDPLSCHRTILVSRELEAAGAGVSHIHPAGGLEPHAQALTRLLDLLGMAEGDLFRSREDLIADAYAAQEAKIAYVDPDLRVEAS